MVPLAQGGPLQGLLDRLHREAVRSHIHDRLAGAVEIDAVADAQIFEHAPGRDPELLEPAFPAHLAHLADLFDQSGEHGYLTSAV